jgi:acetyl-CoA carboxylase carboxyl transferase subunit alpha
VGAEERGQSEAIARNLLVMAHLRTPILCTVIGEGGSGGALAIGVGDRLLMLQFTTYSVISPEGCASILWRSADKAELAAEAMAITSAKLKEHDLVDVIVPEPLGGAHRDPGTTAASLKAALVENLDALLEEDLDDLMARRYQRLMGFGRFKE